MGRARVSPPMSAETTTQPREAATIVGAEERHAEVERRLDEAADVFAETLLDLWRRERREQRGHAERGTS